MAELRKRAVQVAQDESDQWLERCGSDLARLPPRRLVSRPWIFSSISGTSRSSP